MCSRSTLFCSRLLWESFCRKTLQWILHHNHKIKIWFFTLKITLIVRDTNHRNTIGNSCIIIVSLWYVDCGYRLIRRINNKHEYVNSRPTHSLHTKTEQKNDQIFMGTFHWLWDNLILHVFNVVLVTYTTTGRVYIYRLQLHTTDSIQRLEAHNLQKPWPSCWR